MESSKPGTKKPRAKNVVTIEERRAELALEIYNRRRRKRHPDTESRGVRTALVTKAAWTCPNPFELCRYTTTIARLFHRADVDRFPETINAALQRIAATLPRITVKAAAEQECERLAG